jgi:hypothetical protein
MSQTSHDVSKAPAGGEVSQADAMQAEAGAGDRTKFTSAGSIPPVQRKGAPGVAQQSASDRAFGAEQQTHEIADAGVQGTGQQLPHADKIAAAFGTHGDKVHGIQAHLGGEAQAATGQLGAEAYANGNTVAFNKEPDLHTAAHEAAHVVQQRGGGVQVKGGVGDQNDQHEKHADEVADRVVKGESAQDLLDPVAGDKTAADGGQETGSKAVQSKAVQFLGSPLGKPLPAGAEKPLEEHDDQRRYSVEQYERMWEAEQGKTLTDPNKKTIDRGCIGISANNIAGGGNPLDYSLANFGDFDHAHKFMEGKNKELHEMRADPKQAGMAPQGEYVLFAKQFWSNQKDPDGANKKADDKAFRPDPKTGRVDMSGYKYQAQPGFVNFDYGFWDDASQSFWHANHSQPGMIVYQSTKEHFIAGYTDFDRCIFGVALAKNYDPAKAAMDANRAGANTNKPENQPAPEHH